MFISTSRIQVGDNDTSDPKCLVLMTFFHYTLRILMCELMRLMNVGALGTWASNFWASSCRCLLKRRHTRCSLSLYLSSSSSQRQLWKGLSSAFVYPPSEILARYYPWIIILVFFRSKRMTSWLRWWREWRDSEVVPPPRPLLVWRKKNTKWMS